MSVAPPRPDTARSGLLLRYGYWVGRHAKAVLLTGLVVLIAAGALGSRAFAELQSGGFDDPASDSTIANGLNNAVFPADANLVLLVTANDGDIRSTASAAAGKLLTERLTQAPFAKVSASYFTSPAPGLMAADHSSALILLVVAGNQGQAVQRGETISADFSGFQGAVSVRTGGTVGVFSDINTKVTSSLAVAESIAVPITLLLLLLVFGSIVAAMLPLVIGVFAIIGTFAELAVLGSLTDVSIFAINLTTALGLGLGIDYGLLLVSRFREQLAKGDDPADAVATTVATAGRTIAFSAAAVAAALATLTVFPLYFLSSFGYAGIGVVVIAALGALLLTPAALALLGPRVDSGRIPFLRPSRGGASKFWGRLAAAVFRRPLRFAGPVLVLLLLAASPLLGIHFALPDETVLPTSSPSRAVADVLAADYPSRTTATMTVISREPADGASARREALALAGVSGVTAVSFSGGTVTAGGTIGPVDPAAGPLTAQGFQRLRVSTSVASKSTAASDVVDGLRRVSGVGYLIGGADAALTDTLAAIGRPLPVVLIIIVITTFVLLFLFTGSLVQPLRALVVNSLSLAAAVGIVTWIFQDGHLLSIFGSTARPMDASMTVLLLCIAFGLSMDYEVFLSSRITELHFAGESLETAITQGLARTGRIVTSAALLLAVSFFAFATSSVSMLQLFGMGCGIAVLVDATLVRGILVPAVMRLLGRANFWAPKPLVKLHAKIGVSD